MATVIPFQTEIVAAAKAENIDPALLAGLIKQESGFNPNARSPAGAGGLTQLMPGTAAGLGVTNVSDPVQAIRGGAKYLAQQLRAFGGNVTKALAAYNAGPGAVQKYGGVPPYAETQHYVKVVQENAAAYRAGGLTAAAGALGTTSAAPTAATDTPAAAGDVSDRWSGAGIFAPIFRGLVTGLVWAVLILGGAALVVVGLGRLAGAGKATS